MENELHDSRLQKALEEASAPFPFSEMEEEVMSRIRSYEKRRHLVQENLRLSWLFYILGLLSGFLMLGLLPDWAELELTAGSKVLLTLAALALISLLLWFGGRLMNLTERSRA